LYRSEKFSIMNSIIWTYLHCYCLYSTFSCIMGMYRYNGSLCSFIVPRKIKNCYISYIAMWSRFWYNEMTQWVSRKSPCWWSCVRHSGEGMRWDCDPSDYTMLAFIPCASRAPEIFCDSTSVIVARHTNTSRWRYRHIWRAKPEPNEYGRVMVLFIL
jgi:hypothetical protein